MVSNTQTESGVIPLDEHTLIIGASGGLGQALVNKFAQEKKGLILAGRDLASLKKTFPGYEEHHLYEVDITNWQEVDQLFTTISQKNIKLKNIINTVGLGLFGPVETYTEQEIKDIINVNLIGAIYLNQRGFVELKGSNGYLVNILSTAGLEGKKNESVYCASKWGLRGFLEALRQEASGSGVKILAVYPGGIKTPFFEKSYGETYNNENFIDPDELADLIYHSMNNYQTLETNDLVIRRIKQ